MRNVLVFLSILLIFGVLPAYAVPEAGTAPSGNLHHPRPAGTSENDAPVLPQEVQFVAATALAGVDYDVVAKFPKSATPEFSVDSVTVNGVASPSFLVENNGIYNGNRRVHGSESFSVATLTNWEPGKSYEVVVTGKTESGSPIKLAAAQTAPAKRESSSAPTFLTPTAEFPYHHIMLTLLKESLEPGTVTSVEVDGVPNRDARFFNSGVPHPAKAKKDAVPEGETYEGKVEGARDFQVKAPVNWINGSEHSIRIKVKGEGGQEKVYEGTGKAPASGGYWNADWPHATSLVLKETVGILRQGEPVKVSLGFFADDIKKPEAEIRVITYDPKHPKAGPDGYVVVPSQVEAVSVWRDDRLLASDERDKETGELVHRYDATTSVDLLFFADVQPYQEKVFQVVYGNDKAEPVKLDTDLKVTKGEGLSQTVENQRYKIYLSTQSGSVEQITILGEGEPVLLEHKLETNGAVHWNPDIYSPPTPWVHASDWEKPIFDQIAGPLMLRTRRYGPMPHMDSVNASVAYEFYAGKPYVVMSSFMDIQKDLFVQAMRNAEIVFNHAVLNEFVWEDPLGKLQKLDIESSRKHPIHALEIPTKSPWYALINREKGVGFACINLAYENGNRYGQPPSETQPYFYVQNGPWIYVARPLVYPFGGSNFTRMMPVRAGSFYAEKTAWLPFRLAKDNEPFQEVAQTQKMLTHPLLVHEWMATDKRTPEKWVMPILTMPFDEGVAGAVSGHKEKK